MYGGAGFGRDDTMTNVNKIYKAKEVVEIPDRQRSERIQHGEGIDYPPEVQYSTMNSKI